jgi:tripartite-type tricarboxylate transporter receptor subunit TctC
MQKRPPISEEVKMQKRCFAIIAALAACICLAGVAHCANPFYEGKVIRIVVGLSAGGGYDAYARALARHLPRHIPGHPTIIVDNMTGAGSLIAANYLYKVAKPDGLTIGHFVGNLFLNQIMKQQGVEFDARKFEFIGAAAKEEAVFAFSKKSGITSIEKWMAAPRPVKMAGQGPGSAPDNAIKVAKVVLGLPTQLVSGYKGTPEQRLAVEGGEVDGTSFAWAGMKATWSKSFESGEVVPVLQAVPKPFPELLKVPLAISLAKTDEARQMVEVGLHKSGVFSRPFVLPPGTPKDRVRLLAKAFQDTLSDKEFLSEAGKAKLDIELVTGEEIEKAVASIFTLEPGVVARLQAVFFN